MAYAQIDSSELTNADTRIFTENQLRGLLKTVKMDIIKDWQGFEEDSAREENRRPAEITARRVSHIDDYVVYTIKEDGKYSGIDYVLVADKYGDPAPELAHHVFKDW